MPAQTYGLSGTDIFWSVEDTEVDQSSVDFISISCTGLVKESVTTIDEALILVPDEIEIGPTGPVLSATRLTGATLDTRSASFGADGTIVVNATYKIPASIVINGPGGEGGDESTSESDRYDLRVELTDVPILTHPVALSFKRVDKLGLKNLLEGDIWPNKDPDWDSVADPDGEFRTNDEGGEEVNYPFDTTMYDVDGITASPKDFARMIASGISVYQRPAVRWMWYAARSAGPDTDELNRVGDVTVPPRAPKVNNRQWIYAGAADSEQALGAHTTTREYILSERGGVLKQLYKGGDGDINEGAT